MAGAQADLDLEHLPAGTDVRQAIDRATSKPLSTYNIPIQACFQDMVSQILHKVSPPAVPGQQPPPPVDLKTVILWLDFVAEPCGAPPPSGSAPTTDALEVAAAAEIAVAKEAIDGCVAAVPGGRSGIFVLIDAELAVLQHCR